MLSKSKAPPRQDRRGFYEFFVLSSILLILSVFGYLGASEDNAIRKGLSIALAIVGVCGFIIAEGLSRPPHNGPHEFVRDELLRGKRGEDEKVLVCLGDSLTHGACSANWVDCIIPTLKAQKCNINKLKVVNAGQNSICTHTILHERVDHVVSCKPDYVFVMIGSNDVMAMYRQDWAKDKMRLWDLPQVPTSEIAIANLTQIVKRLLDETSANIAIATLPPFGEDANCSANRLLQKINKNIREIKNAIPQKRFTVIDINDALWKTINTSSEGRKSFHSVDNFLPYAVLFGLFHCVFGIRWSALSNVFTGNVVMSESLHLNEIGGEIVKEKVVEWLKGQAEVKSDK